MNIPAKSLSTIQDRPGELDLPVFFPYQVRAFYRAVSDAVAVAYSSKYGLTASEWRTMAILGPEKSLTAGEIVARSTMDKVNVSRAVKGLQAHGFLIRNIDDNDKRRSLLKLTENGATVFLELIPAVKLVEQDCLNGLNSNERDILCSLMLRVQQNAEKIPQG